MGQALEWARRELRSREAGGLEAQVLLSRLLDQPRAWVLAHPEAALTCAQADTYGHQVQSCAAGMPLAYLTGIQEFFGLEFEVNPTVFIPRPETELLVERALSWIRGGEGKPQARPIPAHVVEVGTGSGCLAISLAVESKGLKIVAGDLSREALEVARRNVRHHGVADRVALVQMDLLGSLKGPLDLILANLPYMAWGQPGVPASSRFEPRLARDGGEDGLRIIARLLEQAVARLPPGSLALLEIEASQGAAVLRLARSRFPRASIQIVPDLAGLDRLLEIRA